MERRTLLKIGTAAVPALFITTAAAGCSSSGGSGESGTPTITMLVLGDKPTNGHLESMLEKLNPLLLDKAQAQLALYYVEWADWQTQYNVQLLSGDGSIDLIGTATDWLFAWDNATKGAFLELEQSLLQENAPKTWAQVEKDGHWDLTKLDDVIYFAPEDAYTQYTNHGFFYRGDWATEAGFADGTITKFEDFTTYFQWVKDNKPEAYPWDVAGSNAAVLDGYIAGHGDFQTLQGVSAGNYYPLHTTESAPTTVTSWLMEGTLLQEAAEIAKQWNDLGVWREDALNYDGDTRELFYAGLSGADQHHTQTFLTGIVYNMNEKQKGSDPKFFYWGSENGNFFKDLKTHGAMAVSATSSNPEKALAVYDTLRNDEECYRLINFGIEGTDYVVTDDDKLDYPEGYDPSTDGLGANFWYGRMDDFELDKVTDAENKWDVYAELDKVAKEYPYETLVIDQNAFAPSLSAVSGVLAEYLPQLQYGKYDDPAAAIEEMRSALDSAGLGDIIAAVQEQMDTWAKDNPIG